MPRYEPAAKVIELVAKLNAEYQDRLPEPKPGHQIYPWSYSTCGLGDGDQRVTFMGQTVWTDHEEVRETVVDEGPDGWPVYEDLEKFLRIEAQEILEQLASVNWVKPAVDITEVVPSIIRNVGALSSPAVSRLAALLRGAQDSEDSREFVRDLASKAEAWRVQDEADAAAKMLNEILDASCACDDAREFMVWLQVRAEEAVTRGYVPASSLGPAAADWKHTR